MGQQSQYDLLLKIVIIIVSFSTMFGTYTPLDDIHKTTYKLLTNYLQTSYDHLKGRLTI